MAAVRRTFRRTAGDGYELVDVTLTASELELAFRLHHDPRTYVATFPCAPPWLGWVTEVPAESPEQWSSELRWTLGAADQPRDPEQELLRLIEGAELRADRRELVQPALDQVER